ncbi:MAG: hypothetical protein JKY56_11525 [Kofleriaceae bacterium]|nr:hypothetical protein [Kofleriaceae bacterium]
MNRGIALCLLVLTSAVPVAGSAPTPDAAAGNPNPTSPPASELAAPQQPSAPIHLVGAIANKAGSQPSLIGSSGQLYVAQTPLHWQRSLGGGVSTDVQSMHRTKSGVLYAQGKRAPLFIRNAGIWSASPLANKGASTFSQGPRSIITTGRHIYQLGATGWQRIASARSTIRAIWSQSPGRMYIATADGKLYVGGKAGWKPLRLSLLESDEITAIVGVGNQVVALTSHNRLFSISPKAGARMISLAGFTKLRIHRIAVVKNQIALVGVSGPPTKRESVLVAVGPKKLRLLEKAWQLNEGDRFTVLFEDPKQQLLLATKRGQIRLRQADGSWQNGVITAELPTVAEPGVGSRPAHSN